MSEETETILSDPSEKSNDNDTFTNKISNVNDYSRFNEIKDDSDDETDDKKVKEEQPKLSLPELLVVVNKEKETGNVEVQSNKLMEAKMHYLEGIKLIEANSKDLPTPYPNELNSLIISLNSNLAMVLMKEGDWREVILITSKVLSIDSGNVKALFRRGTAYNKVCSYDEAKRDLEKLLGIDPPNASAKKEIAEVLKVLYDMIRYDMI